MSEFEPDLSLNDDVMRSLGSYLTYEEYVLDSDGIKVNGEALNRIIELGEMALIDEHTLGDTPPSDPKSERALILLPLAGKVFVASPEKFVYVKGEPVSIKWWIRDRRI